MLTGEPTVALTGVLSSRSSVSAGSGTLTITSTEPAVTVSLTITEEPDTITATGHIGDTLEPPGLAEILLCIFAPITRAKDIDGLMGDFAERFARDSASGMSRRRAVCRYWGRVLRSVRPQIWQAIQRVGWLGLIAAFLRQWF
jgi:hypothetical protein